MRAYYNENDPNCVAWLRALIAENLIAPGDVDDRDIRDVKPVELRGYTQCHFFAGIGGWSLALRRAAWPDHRPVWTGSCPCQPFSAAGKRGGFADERHLWPAFHWHIAQCRPAVVLGEQVASAADWLRLVRGDLEALDYAVGAMPIEAASAGADHLRDRFWFVADAASERSRAGLCESRQIKHGHGVASDGRPIDMAFAERGGREGRQSERSWAGSALPSGEADVAHADQPQRRQRDEQPARQQSEQQPDPSSRDGGDVGDTFGARTGRHCRDGAGPQAEGCGERRADGRGSHASGSSSAGAVEWVIGADGKARRVKSGVRLLAHGVPGRVGLLRGFGNAIDPRPAAAFIKAYMS